MSERRSVTETNQQKGKKKCLNNDQPCLLCLQISFYDVTLDSSFISISTLRNNTFLCKLICVHASGYPSTPDLNSNWCYLGTGIWKRDLPGKHKNVVL